MRHFGDLQTLCLTLFLASGLKPDRKAESARSDGFPKFNSVQTFSYAKLALGCLVNKVKGSSVALI